ncbi:unnamed protein product [Spirodela intermedia]|uniref:starch synthase n=1 Tax=Spirodela intermedia TaxID=51605 RepID=A0A7I8KWN2_SPIIN|nr:unnamed protein product [Spirodela intermedia]
MASLGRAGPLSCFLEPSNDKCSCVHRSHGQLRSAGFHTITRCRSNTLHLNLHIGTLPSLRVGGTGQGQLGFTRSGRGIDVRRSALGGKGSAEGEDSGDGGVSDVDFGGDEVLKATIEKSKKALAAQKSLLEQIVEKRKVVSSTKEGTSNTGRSTVAYSESDGSSQDSYSSSTSGRPNKSDINLSYSNQNGQVEISVGEETSIAESLGLIREASLEVSKSEATPSSNTTVLNSSTIDDQLEESQEKNKASEDDEVDVAPEEENLKPPPLAGENVMNIILVAAECAPWSKTGGLGDVAGALPKALARRGHRVMVVVPRYGNYSEPQDIGVRKYYKVDGQDMEVTFHHAFIDGVDFVFMDSPVFRHRENAIYEGNRVDILKRMVLLSKAAVEVPWHVPCGGVCYGDGNLVFIANDWHTALLPVYLKAYYRDNGMMKYTRSVLVVHNIAHQGRGPLEDFGVVDLPGHYIDLFKLYDPVGGEHFNIFAAGLKAADQVVTVSHGYAWELKTSEGGWGLHEIIGENDWKFRGIVNGIDTEDWHPAVDVHLQSDGYTNYTVETVQEGKAQCKAGLQRELGLPVRPEVPLVGFIGRLDHQKGVDIIAEAIPWMASQDMQLVMLGTGRSDLEDMVRGFQGQYGDKVRSWVGFSVKMAHRITAGADILLMPSRFEPCGLNQLYAMVYGTVPVVHAVGGLRDTVLPFNPFEETGLGWTFDRAEPGKLIHALGNCFNTFWNYKKSWEGLQRRGMTQDLSWDHAAQLYEQVLVAAKFQW